MQNSALNHLEEMMFHHRSVLRVLGQAEGAVVPDDVTEMIDRDESGLSPVLVHPGVGVQCGVCVEAGDGLFKVRVPETYISGY